MGMYTELNIGVSLKKDTPENVIDILKFMLNEEACVKTPKHPFFKTDNWKNILLSDSYYFGSRSDSSIKQDDADHEYKLNIRCNFKNYDNEIEKFLDFIAPYIKTTGFIGYTRYEEFDDPCLIYNNYGTIEIKNVQVK